MFGKDTRVVEMQFKNKQFEKNMETSQKSLEKFKKELNFDETSKGVEKFGRSMEALNFSKMADNIQRLTDKFTGLGTVSEFIMSKVRHSLEEAANSAIRFSKSLTFDQISAGKQKFEDLNKSIQTIMAATGKSESEVSDVLERLNEYTDWTSYNFSDMAQNIGKFTSVGIPLEQAEKQMEGIANWAARSGAGINEASRAMYNLSQAMGVGSLKLMDWKSIENAGMATKEFKEQLIEAGVAAGTLVAETKKDANGVEQVVYKTAKSLGKQEEVNFQNLSQTLSKGWANTTVIGNTLMGYYYDDLAMESKKTQELTEDQKKMFEDMFKQSGKIDDKGWQKVVDQGLATDELKQRLLDTAESFGSLTSEVTEDGNKIYKAVDAAGKEIEFTLDTFEKGLGGNWLTRNVAKTTYAFDDLAEKSYEAAMKCMSFTDVLNAWKDMISTGWMASFQHIFGNLSESMQLFSAMCNKVSDSLGNIFGVNGAINTVLSVWESAGGRESLWSTIIGETDDPNGGEDKLYEGAYGLLDVIKDIGKMISEAFWDFMKDIASNFYSEDELANWEENSEFRLQFLGYRIKEFTDKIKTFVGSIRDFFHEIPEGASKSRWEIIKDVIKAVFSAISLAVQTISGIFTFVRKIKKQLEPSFKAIGDLFYSLTQGIVGSEKDLRKSGGIKNFFSKLADVMIPITNIINKVVIGITDLIKSFVNWGKESGFFIKAWETIKSVVSGVSGFIDKMSGPIFDLFKGIGNAFSELFTKGISKETLKNAGKALFEAFKQVFDTLLSFAPDLWEKVKAFFAKIFSISDEALGGKASSILGTIRKYLQILFGGIGNTLHNLIDGFGDGSMMDVFKAIFGGGIGLIGDLIRAFRDMVKDVNLYDLIMGFLGGLALLSLVGVLRKAKKVIGAFGDIADSISGVFEGIKERIAGKEKTFDEKFVNIAKGIAMIAAVIVVLGKMRWQDALQGGIAVIGIMGAMALFIWGLGKIMKKMKASDVGKMVASVLSVGAGLILLAAGIYILVRALKPLANMNWEQLGKMGAGLTVILALFAAFSFVVNKTKVKFSAMAGIALLAVGIGVMVLALKPLAKMNWEGMAKMGVGLLAILVMLAGFSHIMGTLKGTGVGQVGLLAIGIGILVFALKPLADMDWDKLLKMGVALTAVLVLLAGFSHIMGSIKGKGLGSSIALAISIAILVKTLMPFADMDWDEMLKMGVGLGGILLLLAGFSHIMGSIKGKGIFSTIFLATGIVILMEAIKPLAHYDWEELAKMGAGLLGVLVTLALFSRMSKNVKASSMFGVIFLATGILLLFEALKPLVDYDWEDLAKMGAGLLGVLGILALANKLFIEKLNMKNAIAALVVMIGFAALMAVFGATLVLVEDVGADKMLAFAASIAILAIAVGIIMGSTAKIDESQTAKIGKKIAIMAVALVAVAAVMIVFGMLLDKTQGVEPAAMLAFSASIVLIAAVIALIVAVIGGIKESRTNGIGKKLVVLAVAVVAVAAVMYLFAQMLDKTKGVDPKAMIAFAASILILVIAIAAVSAIVAMLGKVDAATIAKGSAGLVAVGTALGAVIDILASFAQSALDKMTTALIDLGTALKWFDEDVEDIDMNRIREGMSLVEDLCNVAIHVIDKGDLAKQLNSYSDAMTRLGAGIWAFNANAGSTTEITNARTAIGDLVAMSDDLTRLKEISGIEQTIANIAGAIGIYIDTLEGKKLEGAPDSSKIRDVFVALNEAIPDDTLLADASSFADDAKAADLNSYAIGLKNISTALESFAKGTESLEFDSIETAIGKLQQISDLGPLMSEKITTKINIGDFINFEQEVVKEKQSLASFATDIKTLAIALREFGTQMGSLTDTEWAAVDTGIGSLQRFAVLQDNLPNVGGFLDAIVGTKNLTTFGKKLPSLGKGLKGFCTEIQGCVSLQNGEAGIAASVLEGLSSAAAKVDYNSGFISYFANKDIEKFGSQIPSLGEGVKGFAENVKDIEELKGDKLKTATEILIAICTAASKIPYNSGAITLWKNIDYNTFGSDSMGKLGTGVVKFAEQAKGINTVMTPEQLKVACDTLVSVCTAISKVPANAGVKTFFEDIKYDRLAQDMGRLGEGLVNFVEAAKNISYGTSDKDVIELYGKLGDMLYYIAAIMNAAGSFQFETEGNDNPDALHYLQKLSDLANIGEYIAEIVKAFVNSLIDVEDENGNIINYLDLIADTSLNDQTRNIADVLWNMIKNITTLVDAEEKMHGLIDSDDFKLPKLVAETFTKLKEALFNEFSESLSTENIDERTKEVEKELEPFLNIMDRIAKIVSDMMSATGIMVTGKTYDIWAENALGMGEYVKNMANSLAVFIEALKSTFTRIKDADSTLDSIEKIEEYVNKPLSIMERIGTVLNSMESYVGSYKKNSIQSWFNDLVGAYSEFYTQLKVLDNSGDLTWSNNQEQAFKRISEIADVIAKMDKIESPTVSVVLDMGSADDQIKQWRDNISSGLSLGFNQTITMKLDTEQFEQITAKDYSLQLTELNTEVTTLREKLTDVNTKLDSFRVVMDTGAMVGALGPGINLYLGRDSFEAGRGIYNGIINGRS